MTPALRLARDIARASTVEECHAVAEKWLARLKKQAPAKSLPEPKRAERKAAKKESAREKRRRVYAEVDAREDGCAIDGRDLGAGWCWGALTHDHWQGGNGRKEQKESVENVWRLCVGHHDKRQENWPSAAFWNRIRSIYCAAYGLPFEPHIEHAAVAR